MKKWMYVLLVGLLSTFFAVGCTDCKTENDTDKEQENQEEVVDDGTVKDNYDWIDGITD